MSVFSQETIIISSHTCTCSCYGHITTCPTLYWKAKIVRPNGIETSYLSDHWVALQNYRSLRKASSHQVIIPAAMNLLANSKSNVVGHWYFICRQPWYYSCMSICRSLYVAWYHTQFYTAKPVFSVTVLLIHARASSNELVIWLPAKTWLLIKFINTKLKPWSTAISFHLPYSPSLFTNKRELLLIQGLNQYFTVWLDYITCNFSFAFKRFEQKKFPGSKRLQQKWST